jgi:hypothetical protein
MEQVILGRKATEQEAEQIAKANEILAYVGLEIYAVGAPRPKKG